MNAALSTIIALISERWAAVGISFTLIALAITLRLGHYTHGAFLLLLVAFAIATHTLVRPRGSSLITAQRTLLICFVVLLGMGFLYHPILYPTTWESFEYTVWALRACVVFFVVPLYAMRAMADIPAARRTAFFAAVLVALALRALVPVASPYPRIDVYAVQEESARNLLEGENPYATVLERDIYNHHRRDGTPLIAGYWYMPGNLVIETIALFATGDVRYGHIAFEIVFLAVLWFLLRRRSEIIAELSVLLMLYQPVGLFVIEQSWNEPLILGFLSLTILFARQRKWKTASTLFGMMIALKQYFIFTAMHWLLVRRHISSLLFVMLGALAFIVPFLLPDADAFIKNGVLYQFGSEFRTDSLSLSTLLYPLIGATGKWWSIAVAVMASVFFMWKFRAGKLPGMLAATTLTMFALFLFGNQAFCNYYYLVQGFLLLTLIPDGETAA